MRALILALLVAGTASAQAPEPPDETITLSPAQVKELQAQIREWVGQAYRAGQADSKARCASLI